MGPNVKFVSAITDAFSNKKKWGSIFFCKKNQTEGGGGGSGGGLVKDHTFAAFFSAPFPKFNGAQSEIYYPLRRRSPGRAVSVAYYAV